MTYILDYLKNNKNSQAYTFIPTLIKFNSLDSEIITLIDSDFGKIAKSNINFASISTLLDISRIHLTFSTPLSDEILKTFEGSSSYKNFKHNPFDNILMDN